MDVRAETRRSRFTPSTRLSPLLSPLPNYLSRQSGAFEDENTLHHGARERFNIPGATLLPSTVSIDFASLIRHFSRRTEFYNNAYRLL
jgi:hypothetical protein